MSTATQGTVRSADGTTIAFDRYGEGAPIVLVGGAFQHRALDPDTARMAAALGDAGFTAVHYDRRGRGDSTDTQPYAPAREVEDLAAIVDVLGGSVAAFGMSSGAVLALEAAAAGVGITRLALYEAPVRTPGAPPSDPALVDDIDALCAAGEPGDAVERFLAPIAGPEAVAGMRPSPIWPVFEAVAHTLAYDCRLMDATTGADGTVDTGRWAAVAVPTLVLDGGDSDAWMRASSAAIAAGLSDATAETFPGATHEVDVDVLGPRLQAWFG